MIRPLRILVIDESRKDRASLRELLDQSSFTYVLHEASDHLRGLRSYRTLRPDCILVDVPVEGAAAADVLGHLKRRMNGKPVPVIVWTAARLLPLVQAAVQQVGASGWLRKDRTSPHELEKTIRSAVASS